MELRAFYILTFTFFPGNDGKQPFVPPFGIIGRHHTWRHLPDIIRHIAEKTADLFQGVFFGIGSIVDHPADSRIDQVPTQLIFVDVVSEGGLDYRWPTGENLTGALYDDTEMAQTGHRRQAACGRTEDR